MSISGQPQVQSTHYAFATYVNKQRWTSYWHQLDAVCRAGGQSVLYIGVGDNIVPTLLELQGYQVARFDYDSSLGADYSADIRDIGAKVPPASFDVVVCCQMLEHLPFEHFEEVLSQLSAIARKRIILSLPYRYRRIFEVRFKVPLIPETHLYLDIPKFWQTWEFNGQHYWEVGTKGTSRGHVTRTIRRHGTIDRAFRPAENRYHLFYEIRPVAQPSGGSSNCVP